MNKRGEPSHLQLTGTQLSTMRLSDSVQGSKSVLIAAITYAGSKGLSKSGFDKGRFRVSRWFVISGLCARKSTERPVL